MFKIPKPRLRFSLRTLLVLVTLIGIYLAVLTHRAVRQRSVVAFIRQYGQCGVVYEPRFEDLHVPDWLRSAIGDDYFTNVTGAILGGGMTSAQLPEAMDQLATLPTLRTVSVWEANIVDEDFRRLRKLTQISRLDLHFRHQNVTFEGLAQIAPMDNINHLDLFGPSISNAALQTLPKFRGLKTLSLGSSDLNNDGLQFLPLCESLEELTLSNCRVSSEGTAALAKIPRMKKLTFLFMQIDGHNSGGSPDFPPDGLKIDGSQIRLVPTLDSSFGIGSLQEHALARQRSSRLRQKFDARLAEQHPGLSIQWLGSPP